jgi:HNH endonuclease
MRITIVCHQCSKPFVGDHSRVARSRHCFCSPQCHGDWKSDQQRAAFWDKVAICEHGFDCPYCCWPFQGVIRNQGYGNLKVHGKQTSSHRFAWELANNQSLPHGYDAAHWCHARACANFDHIHRATRKENMEDSVRDNRTCKGERRPNSKLTEETAHEAFRLKLLGWGNKDIAECLHLHKHTIANLMNGKLWKHVQRPPLLPKLKPPGPGKGKLALLATKPPQ